MRVDGPLVPCGWIESLLARWTKLVSVASSQITIMVPERHDDDHSSCTPRTETRLARFTARIGRLVMERHVHWSTRESQPRVMGVQMAVFDRKCILPETIESEKEKSDEQRHRAGTRIQRDSHRDRGRRHRPYWQLSQRNRRTGDGPDRGRIQPCARDPERHEAPYR